MTAVDERQLAQERDRAARDEDFFGDLLPEAAELVVLSGLGSARMLQRKMRIGWTLADELLFELHELGVVGEDVDGARQVLVDGDGLAVVLARIATLAAGESPGDDPGDDTTPPVVNLVKTSPPPATWGGGEAGDDEAGEPGAELVIRPYDGLVVARTARQVQTLVVRARQATARQAVWVADQPVVSRTLVVGRQVPKVGRKLVTRTPHGAARAARLTSDWLRDARSADLLAKHAEAGEGDQYAKVASARQQLDLAGRRWLVAGGLGLVVMAGLAWWAPQVFAGALASLAFAAVVAMAPRTAPREFLGGLALAGLAAAAAWYGGPHLAGLVPQPPAWLWWVVGGVLVMVFGWLGRHEDQPLVEMPMDQLNQSHEPKRPTAEMIVDALCRLGIKDLTPANLDKVREETRVIAPGVGRSRRGWHLQLELPWAVTAGQVMDKREQLAAALKRELGTVWPTQGSRHPGHLVLFLSDLPMATAQQDVWPIAERRRVDIFEPVPMFTDQEGRWVDLQIAYKRIIVGGESGSGKSFYVRQIGVAAALDPRTRIVGFDGKANGDLDPLMPIAHGFYVGARPEEMAEQLAAAKDIEREMDRRSRFLRTLPREENPENKVTSPLVDRYPDLAPYVVIVDELQEYTQNEDKEMAKEFTRIFTRFSRLGRSAGIILVVATQYPADGVVPVAMRSNFSTKFCLRVEGHQQVEVILGTGTYAAGLKANLFTTAEAGLAWHKGDGLEPAIIQSVRGLDGPACDELVAVARAIRKSRGLLSGQAAGDGGEIEDAEVVISIAEDTLLAMRQHGNTATAHLGELVGWLQEMRPLNYDSLDVKELGKRLRNDRMKVTPVWRADRTKQGIDLRKQGELDD